ncbi:hypothetical protein ABB02_00414 [Clostridiaceae bacterium JG1575]|nr:hypothetical protein ABB02_00414 [Clostridiaceae bacterium JG1575]
MSQRIATLSILVADPEGAKAVNQLLHEAAPAVLGRMGLPRVAPGLSVICVVLAAPQEAIATLSGRLGQLSGVSVTACYAKKVFDEPLR